MIQRKRKTVIKKGHGHSYNEETFVEEHAVEKFKETDDPKEILQNVSPFAFRGKKYLVIDTETYPTELNDHEVPESMVRRWVGTGKTGKPQDFPFCMSICDGKVAYSIYDTLDNGFKKFKALAPLLEDPEIHKIFHNAKFDMHMVKNIGAKLRGKIHDTVVISKLVNENRNSFELKKLAEPIEGSIVKFEYMVDSFKKTHKIADYRHIPKTLLTQYANADVWNTYLVFMDEYPKMDEELEALYEHELELMMCLWEMERVGIKADKDYETALKTDLQKLADEAEEKIYEQAGRMFNINSSPQLYKVLVDNGLDHTLIKKTDKGNPSLNKKSLDVLANKHGVEIVKDILTYRKYEKLLTTYATGIYAQRDASWRVHGNVNQTEATTGRMSITKPALQTLPKKDTRIRSIFIPEDDYEMYFMDLDQIEYRIFAHYAKAIDLIDAIKKGYDVHQATASIIFNQEYDKVEDEQRVKAKTINFSLIYGQGDSATANALGVSVGDAMDFKRKYFMQIPEAEPFIRQVHRVTRTRGYIKNLYGRKRNLDHNEVYKAPNALIQGCAADYLKSKIVLIYKYLKAVKAKSRMLLIVHDEVVFEIHKNELYLLPKLKRLLSDYETFRVPITAGIEKGTPSWGSKEEQEAEDVEITPDEFKAMEQINVFEEAWKC